MRYLLDSNAVIAVMAHHDALVRRLRAAEPGTVAVSSVVLYELMFGAFNSGRVDANLARLDRLAFPILPFETQDAREAGEIRAQLKRRGSPIGPYDVLIAGQARARSMTIVTANVGEFARVEGLSVENWSRGTA